MLSLSLSHSPSIISPNMFLVSPFPIAQHPNGHTHTYGLKIMLLFRQTVMGKVEFPAWVRPRVTSPLRCHHHTSTVVLYNSDKYPWRVRGMHFNSAICQT